MPSTKQEGWEEAVSGGFLKFEEPGVTFTGLLVDYEKKSTPKGDAHDYKVITKDGAQTFYAPKDLHDKLSGVIIKYGIKNAIVKVTYKEKIKTASGNDFKKFEVLHTRSDESELTELGINPNAEDNF